MTSHASRTEPQREIQHSQDGEIMSLSDSDSNMDAPTESALRDSHGDEHALDNFINAHSMPPTHSITIAAAARLPCPVVIPQRRPGNRRRGFVEAYAPEMETFGIHQDEFINFIRATNKALQNSKWIGAIQLAAAGTSFVPNHIAMGASVAVQVVAGMIAIAESRWKFVTPFLATILARSPC